jgi:hypothetical protein
MQTHQWTGANLHSGCSTVVHFYILEITRPFWHVNSRPENCRIAAGDLTHPTAIHDLLVIGIVLEPERYRNRNSNGIRSVAYVWPAIVTTQGLQAVCNKTPPMEAIN